MGSHAQLINRNLEIFFNKYVTISTSDREMNNKIVFDIVDKLVKKIKEKDSRFIEAIPVGSSIQRLKTSEPDEYDINIVIDYATKRSKDIYDTSQRRYYDFAKNVPIEDSLTLNLIFHKFLKKKLVL